MKLFYYRSSPTCSSPTVQSPQSHSNYHLHSKKERNVTNALRQTPLKKTRLSDDEGPSSKRRTVSNMDMPSIDISQSLVKNVSISMQGKNRLAQIKKEKKILIFIQEREREKLSNIYAL